jgi:transcriptional regulator with XRE-family HTH domain
MAKPDFTLLEQHVIDTVLRMRKAKGWSQKDLAYLSDFSPAFISEVENPKRRAKYKLEHLNRLALAFRCSPKDFLPDHPFAEPVSEKVERAE